MKPFLALVLFIGLLGAAPPAGWPTSPNTTGVPYTDQQCQVLFGLLPYSTYLPGMQWRQADYVMNCGKTAHFVVYPKYAIVSLFYMPAGCTGSPCSGTGDVSYQNGFSSGTKISTDKAFKNDAQLTVDYDLGDASVLSAGVSGGIAKTTTDSSSETISLDQTSGRSWSSAVDGINHDNDVFYLLMNSAVIVQGQGTRSWWNLAYQGHIGALVLPVHVSELRTCAFPSSSAFHVLNRADCNTILAQDPFAVALQHMDMQRFAQVGEPLPYAYDPIGCATQTLAITHERDTDASHEVEKEYSVGYSVSATAGADFKFSQDFTWTNSSTTDATTGTTKTANLSLPCPSANYAGKPLIVVYWDSLYGTFAFVPMDVSDAGVPVLTGTLDNASGQAVRHEMVALTFGGHTYRTMTDKNGGYAFYAQARSRSSVLPSTAQLTVRGVARPVQLRAAKALKISVP